MDPDAITRHLSEGIGQNYEVNQEARAFNLLASFQLVELALKIYISIAYDVIRLRVHGLVPFKPDEKALEKASLERLLRSEEHTSELQSLMRISYAVFCL